MTCQELGFQFLTQESETEKNARLEVEIKVDASRSWCRQRWSTREEGAAIGNEDGGERYHTSERASEKERVGLDVGESCRVELGFEGVY